MRDFNQLFIEADCRTEYGDPLIDHEKNWSVIQNLVEELSENTSYDFKMTDNPSGCQDGAMLGEISGGRYDKKLNQYHFLFKFQFSAYGNFFLFQQLSNDVKASPQPIEPQITKQMVSIIENKGFIFIPEETLNLPYSGLYDMFHGITWGRRFFEKYW